MAVVLFGVPEMRFKKLGTMPGEFIKPYTCIT